MSPGGKQIVLTLLFLAMCADGGWVPANAEGCETPEIDINFLSVEMPSSATQFARDMRGAFQAVCEWWGPTYDGPIHVAVNDVFRESMALVPAWYGKPGYMLFPIGMVASGSAATVHEFTHVFAPNAHRFLAEGLAVYAHDHLNGPPAFPNFGSDITKLARTYAGRANIAVLDKAPTPTPPHLMSSTLGGREVYIVAGSFVRFLIEEFGLPKFRELYAMTPLVPGKREAGLPERWEGVYGLSINQLSSQWREKLTASQEQFHRLSDTRRDSSLRPTDPRFCCPAGTDIPTPPWRPRAP
jgi:hypothetical protein